MDQKEIFKQMVKFNKTAFDNTFAALTLLQEQMQQMTKVFMEQSTWLPQEGKQVLTEWLKALKKGGEDFKKTIDDSFKNLEGLLA